VIHIYIVLRIVNVLHGSISPGRKAWGRSLSPSPILEVGSLHLHLVCHLSICPVSSSSSKVVPFVPCAVRVGRNGTGRAIIKPELHLICVVLDS
jgi:hypothetical protein